MSIVGLCLTEIQWISLDRPHLTPFDAILDKKIIVYVLTVGPRRDKEVYKAALKRFK
jgi:hypothetical protein